MEIMMKPRCISAPRYLMALVFFAFYGCQGTAPVKPVDATVAQQISQSNRKVESSSAAEPQNTQPQKEAVGVQQGGSRQGILLKLRNTVTTFSGKAGVAGSADGTGARASFDAPKGITTDGIFLYVADLNNHTIRKIEISSGLVTTLAGVAGKKGSNDGKGAAARFNRPYGITTDGDNLYVTDSNNHSIRRIDIETGGVTTIAGAVGMVGYIDGSGTQARFFIPEGITTDGNALYVSDTHNHSIRKVEIKSGLVTTLAGLSGAPGMLDSTGSNARFYYPKGITTDGRNLYLVDFGNHRVRKVTLNEGIVTTLAGGRDAVSPDDKSVSQGDDVRLNYPTGITTDGRNLYIVDTFNRAVRKTSLGGSAVITIAGKPELEGSADGIGADARFRDPVGIATDGHHLYVTDSNNHTIRKIK